ncbi:type II and III secretion system protein family protein [Thalassotalea litorea]|uniref:Type II and III secretion system protein family protein n=1 Tax=Thalassotalea litorea TaxID=2020715 RepID=A0A5R9ID05_9GAMM|nr:type II and III secretion system protein family protein [Thalassotalea litorea]TLU61476.1 type II and III secretion system protein family protein [Thalassotalea litorea]
MKAVAHRSKYANLRSIVISVMFLIANIGASVQAGGSLEQPDPTIKIPIHKSKNVAMVQSVHRVSIANPKIADILIIRKDEIYIVGKKLGSTNVMVWDEKDQIIEIYNLEVTHDLATLRERFHRYLPEETIGIESSQGHLVLSGEASSTEKMTMAVRLAEGYAKAAGGNKSNSQVLNMMSVGGGHQVMLEVTVAEVQSEVARRLDSKMLLAVDGNDGTIGITSGSDFLNSLGLTQGIDRGLFGSYLDGDLLLNFALDIAKQNGLAKILAEPNITALSGQQADFLSGGEFPIPVPNRDGITIQYRDFGVGVSFVPTILDSGKINLNLEVLVSELSSTNTVAISPDETNSNLVIPSIIKRTTSTTVELGDGQTIAIGGLISDNFRESVNKIPGLGDIPVLGQLFRSQEFIKGQSELVIMVTPRLVRPFNRDGVPLPTDGFVEPGDMDFYLLGRTSSRPLNETNEANPNASSSSDSNNSQLMLDDGGTQATYGHEISTEEFQE